MVAQKAENDPGSGSADAWSTLPGVDAGAAVALTAGAAGVTDFAAPQATSVRTDMKVNMTTRRRMSPPIGTGCLFIAGMVRPEGLEPPTF